MKNRYFFVLLYAAVLTFGLCVGNCMGQGQPNLSTAAQLDYNANSPNGGFATAPLGMAGPFTVPVGPGAGNLVNYTQGTFNSYFETWVASGPALSVYSGPMPVWTLAGGVHLNLSTLWLGHPIVSGYLFTPTGVGLGNFSITVPYNPQVPFDFTVQSIVADPTAIAGFRLTAAIHVVR